MTFTITINKIETALEEAERAIVLEAMKNSRYKQSKAAELIGISRGNMRTKLTKYFGNTYVGTRDK